MEPLQQDHVLPDIRVTPVQHGGHTLRHYDLMDLPDRSIVPIQVGHDCPLGPASAPTVK